MQRHAWLASPALGTSSPVSDTSAHSPPCTLADLTAFHWGSLLWCFAVQAYSAERTLQWRTAPAAKLHWRSVWDCYLAGLFCSKGRKRTALQPLKGRGDFQNINTLLVLYFSSFTNELFCCACTCVPALPRAEERSGHVRLGWAESAWWGDGAEAARRSAGAGSIALHPKDHA